MSGLARVAITQPVVLVSSLFMANALRDAGVSDGLMLATLGWVVLLAVCVGWLVGGGE